MSENDQPELPPRRLSVNPKSEHFDMDVLKRGVGIRFKGRQRTDIEEYSISEGWVRVQAGKTTDRNGNPLATSVDTWDTYAEYQKKNAELQELNNDIEHLLNGTDVATIAPAITSALRTRSIVRSMIGSRCSPRSSPACRGPGTARSAPWPMPRASLRGERMELVGGRPGTAGASRQCSMRRWGRRRGPADTRP